MVTYFIMNGHKFPLICPSALILFTYKCFSSYAMLLSPFTKKRKKKRDFDGNESDDVIEGIYYCR